MDTKRNDFLVEFELQNSEMNKITGGHPGYSGGSLSGNEYCGGDVGNHDTQAVYYYYDCETV